MGRGGDPCKIERFYNIVVIYFPLYIQTCMNVLAKRDIEVEEKREVEGGRLYVIFGGSGLSINLIIS